MTWKEEKFMELNIIPKFLDEALTPIARETGERLSDIVSLVFTPIIKEKAKRDKKLELFLKDLDNEINKIPEDKIQIPQLHIVAPILEDVGKYYHDEEYLRKMFSKLIASSLNKDNIIQPSYINLIKQLSLYDLAVIGKTTEIYGDDDCLFGAYSANTYFYVFNNAFKWKSWSYASFIYENDKYNLINNNREFIISLINLQRLGLIDIKDNGIDYSKNKSDFGIIGIGYDEKEELYKDYVGSLNIIATPYLIDFMNICCSKDMYDLIKKNECL